METGARREEHYYVPVKGGELFVRDVGRGPTLIVVHGGPDFDHEYLLPDLDRLEDGYRLVYYDQRARGRSRGEVPLDEIDIELYVADLDAIRRHVGGAAAVLGHSWGGLLAMHYAVAHPDRVSHLILLNPAPASTAHMRLARPERARRRAGVPGLDALGSSDAVERGDPDAVASYYAQEFATTFARPADAARLRLSWTRESILRGRAHEERLMARLYGSESFTLIPKLPRIACPTLIIHGALDFFPLACDEAIRDAIPEAKLVVLAGSGHFSYIDAAGEARAAIDSFFAAMPAPSAAGSATCA